MDCVALKPTGTTLTKTETHTSTGKLRGPTGPKRISLQFTEVLLNKKEVLKRKEEQNFTRKGSS